MTTPPVGNESGLVGYWNFNEGTGTTAYDATSNDNDGTINGATWSTDTPDPPPPPPDYDNYSLSFDGEDDYVHFGTVLPDMESMTIFAWIHSNVDNSTIVCEGDWANGNDVTMNLPSNNSVRIRADKNGYSLNASVETDVDMYNSWRHIVWTMNNQESKVYVESSLEGTVSEGGSNVGYHNFILGTEEYPEGSMGHNGYWYGKIDELAIWDTVLSEDEVQTIYNSGNGLNVLNNSGNYMSSSNLVGYWNFNEGEGDTVYDQTENGNHGTIYGATWDEDGAHVDPDSSLSLTTNFAGEPTSGYLPLTVQFLDMSTATDSTEVIYWQWDFGFDDVVDSEEQNPTWTYTEVGEYTVSLIVSDGVSSDTLIKEDYIQADYSEAPFILSIEDITEDQGGWVYLEFLRSFYDTDTLRTSEMYGIERLYDGEWVSLHSIVAYGAGSYITEARTLADSSETTDGMTLFRVIAAMEEGNFASEPAGGYSVDNIAPAVPTGFSANGTESAISISWDQSQEDDFAFYQVYRSTEPDFDPNEIDPLVETVETVYTDSDVVGGVIYYYRISAFDTHGNESEYSDQVSASVLSIDDEIGIPDEYALKQNYPNPFNPVTTLHYDLPEDGLVNITIYDIMGRVVKTMVNNTQEAGYKSVIWNATNDYGNPVSGGVYLYQIHAGDFRQSRKMVLLK
jgi:PKD repeat protein